MAESDLQQFFEKVRQLNAFVALVEANPSLRATLAACHHHHQVVDLAQSLGFAIGRRWGETPGLRTSSDNLLAEPCPAAGEERTNVLVETSHLRMERIHSCQACSPADHWYDQEEWEWVTLLQGSARLQFADATAPLDLSRGDQVLIAPHRRHRLLSTDPAPGTVWLALFWSPS